MRYTIILKNKVILLKAKHNREAMKLSGSFAIKEDSAIKSIIREDGKVII